MVRTSGYKFREHGALGAPVLLFNYPRDLPAMAGGLVVANTATLAGYTRQNAEETDGHSGSAGLRVLRRLLRTNDLIRWA